MGAEVLRLYSGAECGADGYPLAWRRPSAGAPRIPDLVREQAGHRCVRCGHPYRTKQSNPEWSACDARCHHGGEVRWTYIATLCQRCHLYIQGRVKMHQVYPFEHTPWFKPHAAGYYAATILGEDLTREQAEARQDELLALERVT